MVTLVNKTSSYCQNENDRFQYLFLGFIVMGQ